MALTNTITIEVSSDAATNLLDHASLEIDQEIFLQNVSENTAAYLRQGGQEPDDLSTAVGHRIDPSDGFVISLERDTWIWCREGSAVVAITNTPDE